MRNLAIALVAAVVVSACSNSPVISREPDELTPPPEFVIESTAPPRDSDAPATVPTPLTDDGIGYLISESLPRSLVTAELGGEVFCGHELYGWEQTADVAEAWIWADCREYYVDLGVLVIGSAGTAPATIHLAETAGEWSVSFIEEASDGGAHAESVRKMFPPQYADRALSGSPTDRDLAPDIEHAARSKLAS